MPENVYKLSLAESAILDFLLKKNGEYSSKEELLNVGWDSRPISSNSLPVAITNLRKVLSDKDVGIINTPRVGYAIKIYSEMHIYKGKKVPVVTETYNTPPESIEITHESEHIKGIIYSKSISILNGFNFKRLKNLLLYSISALSLIMILFIFSVWSTVTCFKSKYNSTICYQVQPPQKLRDEPPKRGLLLYSKEQSIELN